jgi:hypothetical protein
MFKHHGGMNHGKPPRLGVAQKEAPKRHKNMGYPWLISGGYTVFMMVNIWLLFG